MENFTENELEYILNPTADQIQILNIFVVCNKTEYEYRMYLLLANWPNMNMEYICNQKIEYSYRVSQKARPPKSKKISVFTKTYYQGMTVIGFGKCKRPRGPRPVELINFNKIYSRLDSETGL